MNAAKPYAPRMYDCHGVDCPLGIAHPAPCHDPMQGGVFPLGCGICRSEKVERLANSDVHQVIYTDNLPKAWIKPDGRRRQAKTFDIDWELENEVPEFIAQADEILEQQQQQQLAA